MVEGVICALATPFLKDKVHFDSLVRLVEFQKANGVDNFLVCGTTGEAPLLTEKEKEDVLRCVKDCGCKNSVLGIESPSTWGALKQMELASKYNVKSVLVVAPFFSKATKEGVLQHFLTLANQDFATYLYNVPQRTGFDLEVNVVKELAKHKNVVGIKESGSIKNALEYANWQNFDLFCGEDALLPIYKSIGAKGCVSALCNVFPRWTVNTWQNKKEKHWQKACKVAFGEVNPVVVKHLLKRLDVFISDECRTPLSKANSTSVKAVDKFLREI